jgi:8-oxo-dGTP pyrophosphatase MutT (NUDIX family)
MPKTQIACTFIRNSKDEFFVHQRLASKKTFPNRYGIGAGGHVEADEEPQAAAQRELLEETGLTTPVRYCFTMNFDEPDCKQITHLFAIESDMPITTDANEWQWSGWMSKEGVDKLDAENKLCTDTSILWRRYNAEGK